MICTWICVVAILQVGIASGRKMDPSEVIEMDDRDGVISARIPVPNGGACDWGLTAVQTPQTCNLCQLYYDPRDNYGNTEKGKCVWVPSQNKCYPNGHADNVYPGEKMEICDEDICEELGCEKCGYNWYEKHCYPGQETSYCSPKVNCNCCGPDSNQDQKEACARVCVPEKVHCEWEDWQIGECSKTCGGGTMTSTRVEKVSAENGGDVCEGLSSLEESCNVDECPVHCEWDQWTEGECSETCGEGTRINTRVKLVVEAFGGTCDGPDTETLMCNDGECPVHCEWDEWVIGECSTYCGGGERTNTRQKKTEAAHGGEECTEAATLTESCNVRECTTTPIAPTERECQDKDESYCSDYIKYYGDRMCVAQWFVGVDGDYACRKSCGLC